MGSTDPLMNREQYETLDRPLFGESSSRDRLINLVVGTVTAIMVIVTIISAFAYEPDNQGAYGNHIYFAFCILAVLVGHLWLIYWYRQGDVDPKFRSMIYYNAFTLLLLCICANVYVFTSKKTTATS